MKNLNRRLRSTAKHSASVYIDHFTSYVPSELRRKEQNRTGYVVSGCNSPQRYVFDDQFEPAPIPQWNCRHVGVDPARSYTVYVDAERTKLARQRFRK